MDDTEENVITSSCVIPCDARGGSHMCPRRYRIFDFEGKLISATQSLNIKTIYWFTKMSDNCQQDLFSRFDYYLPYKKIRGQSA